MRAVVARGLDQLIADAEDTDRWCQDCASGVSPCPDHSQQRAEAEEYRQALEYLGGETP